MNEQNRSQRGPGGDAGADPVTLYDQDFYAWTQAQAEALRRQRPKAVDWQHIAEELEGMGGSERREMENRLRVILVHLLKWQAQPGFRSRSWERTLRTQRRDLERHLRRNPSLRRLVPDTLVEQYEDALGEAMGETGLAESAFPAGCPFSVEQALDPDHLPE